MKTCTKCGEEKPLSEFGKRKDSKDGKRTFCRPCDVAAGRSYVARNRAKHTKAHRSAHLKHRYGLDENDYLQMLADQSGACAICFTKPDEHLDVDHDHVTDCVRGLLCGSCNRALGLLQDNTERLRSAISYLERHVR